VRTYIVDIDGTLANIDHRLHFIEGDLKDWDAFFEACPDDAPIDNVIDVIKALGFLGYHNDNVHLVYLTGRPEKVRQQTLAWLLRNGLPKGVLMMGTDGDHRPDTIAKAELLMGLRQAGHNIAGVFEDRPSVCRVWRGLGLTVFQMNDKEF
jgi:hypothetical protein